MSQGAQNLPKSRDFCSPPTKSLDIKKKQHFRVPVHKKQFPVVVRFFFFFLLKEIKEPEIILVRCHVLLK